MKKIFSTKIIILILLFYTVISCSKWGIKDIYPLGMPKGTNLVTMKQISALIARDAPEKYEVASIVDGETRAENLRYLLEFLEKKIPMASDKYPKANVLYVVSYLNQDPLTKDVWELNSIKPSKITKTWQINDLVRVVKLEKNIE